MKHEVFTIDRTVAVLTLAKTKCEQEWPDTCPVRCLWLTRETPISAAYLMLEKALPAPWLDLPAYSDASGRTKAEVLELFDRAIALAQEAA